MSVNNDQKHFPPVWITHVNHLSAHCLLLSNQTRAARVPSALSRRLAVMINPHVCACSLFFGEGGRTGPERNFVGALRGNGKWDRLLLLTTKSIKSGPVANYSISGCYYPLEGRFRSGRLRWTVSGSVTQSSLGSRQLVRVSSLQIRRQF